MGNDIKDIKQLFKNYIKRLPNNGKFHEAQIKDRWQKVMPNLILDRTKLIFLKNKILYIKLESAPLKNEMEMNKDKVINKIVGNDKLFLNIFNEIVFI